jgi:hypothetical protein
MMSSVRHLRKCGLLPRCWARAATPQSAAFAGFTMICGFDRDITQAIANGAMVEVDPTGERPFIRVID